MPFKKPWKVLFNDNIFRNFGWNYYYQKPKKPETNLKHGLSMEIFLLILECYISLERSCQRLFNDSISENNNWNFNHQKPETNVKHGTSMKLSSKNNFFYTVEKILEKTIRW